MSGSAASGVASVPSSLMKRARASGSAARSFASRSYAFGKSASWKPVLAIDEPCCPLPALLRAERGERVRIAKDDDRLRAERDPEEQHELADEAARVVGGLHHRLAHRLVVRGLGVDLEVGEVRPLLDEQREADREERDPAGHGAADVDRP